MCATFVTKRQYESECQKPVPADVVSLVLSGKIFTMDLTERGAASTIESRAFF
jgi:hypothetical protein